VQDSGRILEKVEIGCAISAANSRLFTTWQMARYFFPRLWVLKWSKTDRTRVFGAILRTILILPGATLNPTPLENAPCTRRVLAASNGVLVAPRQIARQSDFWTAIAPGTPTPRHMRIYLAPLHPRRSSPTAPPVGPGRARSPSKAIALQLARRVGADSPQFDLNRELCAHPSWRSSAIRARPQPRRTTNRRRY